MQLCDHVWVNGTRVPDRYCGEANLMLLPVCTLNFVLGNTSILFWKMYLDERACEFAMHRLCRSLSHCSFPFLLLWLLSFCVAMLEELGQNGNDIILFYYILLQIVGCSIIKNFAQFVGFIISPSELVMLLHSLPVNYLYNLWGSINLHNIMHRLSNRQQWLSHKTVSSHGICKLQIHTLCGSLLLFKTERVLRAIQHTCFGQLWVISTNY